MNKYIVYTTSGCFPTSAVRVNDNGSQTPIEVWEVTDYGMREVLNDHFANHLHQILSIKLKLQTECIVE